jgi:HSP20 family protein
MLEMAASGAGVLQMRAVEFARKVLGEDVEIILSGSTLTISAEMKEETRREDESWILNEIRRSSFSRTLELPEGLVGDRATATYERGILTLRIPKAEEVKPKQIRITATGEAQPERELVGSGTAG